MDIFPQRDLLGHGAELVDALVRYAQAGPQSDEAQLILHGYRDWIRKCPYAGHLCFADITFFYDPDSAILTDQGSPSVGRAFSIVMTPESSTADRSNGKHYSRVLSKYLASEHTMARHKVFASGLPYLDEGYSEHERNPSIANDLDFLESTPLRGRVENRFLMADMFPDDCIEDPEILALPVNGDSDVIEVTPINEIYRGPHASDEYHESISSTPIEEQWKTWCAIWKEEAQLRHQMSAAGKPLRWLIAFPVVVRREVTTSIACVFLGFDSVLSEEQVKRSLRYVLLHLYESNATTLLLRRGEILGRLAALTPAVHELRKVISAIRSDLTANVAQLLRQYFTALIVDTQKHAVDSERRYLALDDLVQKELTTAARIQSVVFLSSRGKAISDSEVTAQADRITADCAIDIPPEPRGLSERSTTLFRAAVCAALRNAIEHSFFGNGANGALTVSMDSAGSLTSHSDTIRLTIRNSFRTSELNIAMEAKESGTIHALREYVRAYRGEVNKVKLQRCAHVVADFASTKRDEWETHIPPSPGIDGPILMNLYFIEDNIGRQERLERIVAAARKSLSDQNRVDVVLSSGFEGDAQERASFSQNADALWRALSDNQGMHFLDFELNEPMSEVERLRDHLASSHQTSLEEAVAQFSALSSQSGPLAALKARYPIATLFLLAARALSRPVVTISGETTSAALAFLKRNEFVHQVFSDVIPRVSLDEEAPNPVEEERWARELLAYVGGQSFHRFLDAQRLWFSRDPPQWNDALGLPHSYNIGGEFGVEKHKEIVRRIIPRAPDRWWDNESGYALHQSLKSVMGQDAQCAEGEKRPLSLGGAYFVFLRALLRSQPDALDGYFVKSWEPFMRVGSDGIPEPVPFFPNLGRKAAARTGVAALFDLFMHFMAPDKATDACGLAGFLEPTEADPRFGLRLSWSRADLDNFCASVRKVISDGLTNGRLELPSSSAASTFVRVLLAMHGDLSGLWARGAIHLFDSRAPEEGYRGCVMVGSANE